ncbi:MAG: hypothetical protein ACI9R3_005065 [Verrucomicrobiales bacterium]|jgi:hypothetical protein
MPPNDAPDGMCRLSRFLLPVVFVAACLLNACDGGSSRPEPGDVIARSAMPVGRAQACSRCHQLPPADSLPRHVWPKVIEQMKRITVEMGEPLHEEDLAEASRYYRTESSVILNGTVDPDAESLGDGEQWTATHFTPPGLEQALVPAVAHVVVTPMATGEFPSVLVAELRSRSLLHLPLQGKLSEPAFLYPMLRDLNYPAHVHPIDWNQDGLSDFVVAGMGTLQPDNTTKGSIVVLQQEPDRRFKRRVIAENLARPASVQAADFDNDGDPDVIVSAFGLRETGQLAVIENQTASDGSDPVMKLHTLDPRDGFASIDIADMDGDGALDIVAVLSQEHEQVIVFRNEGGMHFSSHLVWAAPHPSWAFTNIQVVDINADGLLDIVTVNGDSLDYNEVKPYSGVQWFENSGELKFQERRVGKLPGACGSDSADMDGDGDLDLIATAFMPLSSPAEWISQQLASIVWFENPGATIAASAVWKTHIVERHGASHPTVAAADCDGDGMVDIVVGNYVWIDEKRGPLYRSPYVSIYSRKSP